MVALGVLGLWMVTRTFEDYRERWEEQLEPLPVRSLFRPLANEVARALLLKVEASADESQQRDRSLIGEGLDKILEALPGIERLAIVDRELNLQYASAPSDMALTLASEEYASLLSGENPLRRQMRLRSGQLVTEVVLPVFDDENASAERRRLGSVLVHYRPDSELTPTQLAHSCHAILGCFGECFTDRFLIKRGETDAEISNHAVNSARID